MEELCWQCALYQEYRAFSVPGWRLSSPTVPIRGEFASLRRSTRGRERQDRSRQEGLAGQSCRVTSVCVYFVAEA